MNNKKNTRPFILIGYRCTGKTSVAKLLGDELACPVYDSDLEIQHQAEKSIAQIFEHDGETAFRDLEESTIAEILQRPAPFILATGGGAVLRAATRKRLKTSGNVIWLTAEPETVFARLSNDAATKTMRPRLTRLPALEEIETLLRQRSSLYAETAHQIIKTDHLRPVDIVERIRDAGF